MSDKIINIEKMVYGGKGLSRDLRKVTMVPFTLPGEKVSVRIKKEYNDFIEAECVEVIEPSRERVAPECAYFGRCGGCQISHARYEEQVRIKEQSLKETLKRNHVSVDKIEVISDAPFGYRHRARLKFNSRELLLGFHQRESYSVVDIQECLCLTPGLNALLDLLRKNISDFPAGLQELDCYENDQGQTAVFLQVSVPQRLRKALEGKTNIYGPSDMHKANLTVQFRDYRFPMRPDIFLQVNPLLWKAMIQEMESHHENSEKLTLVEFYSGAGFFTRPMSRIFRTVIACEENRHAVRYARQNHEDTNIKWICQKVENLRIPKEATVALVNPPRRGLNKKVIKNLLDSSISKISYVSCDPPTFARDTQKLSRDFHLSKLTLLDLFPQTFHFEILALLQR